VVWLLSLDDCDNGKLMRRSRRMNRFASFGGNLNAPFASLCVTFCGRVIRPGNLPVLIVEAVGGFSSREDDRDVER
jgi:hypothetical protein